MTTPIAPDSSPLNTRAGGDYVVYKVLDPTDPLPWKVVVTEANFTGRGKPLAGFSIRALAVTFARLREQTSGEFPRERVLVVVENGIARLLTTHDVDAVVVNMGVAHAFARSEILPVHVDFGPMLEQLGIDWPVSSDGRRREPTSTSAMYAVSSM